MGPVTAATSSKRFVAWSSNGVVAASHVSRSHDLLAWLVSSGPDRATYFAQALIGYYGDFKRNVAKCSSVSVFIVYHLDPPNKQLSHGEVPPNAHTA